MEKKKPIVLVWEPDQAKGGASITALVEELYERRQMLADLGSTPEACEEYVFRTSQADGRPTIPWHRIKDFQLMSLTMIAQSGLVDSPAYVVRNALKFYIPNVTSDPKKLSCNKPVCLYTSPFNPGAAEAANELATAVLGLSATDRPPDGCAAIELELPAWDEASPKATHFLLYLSDETFVGDAGRQFADQMRVVKARDIPYLMIHENDPARHGCEFGHFFSTTPQDLIENGIYGPLAITFSWGAHRQVSLVLAAKVLGAEGKQNRNKLGALQRSTMQALSQKSQISANLRRMSTRNVKPPTAQADDVTLVLEPEGDRPPSSASMTSSTHASITVSESPTSEVAQATESRLWLQILAVTLIQRVARGYLIRISLAEAGLYDRRRRGQSGGYWSWPNTLYSRSPAETAAVLRHTLAASRQTKPTPPGFPPGYGGTEQSRILRHSPGPPAPPTGPGNKMAPTGAARSRILDVEVFDVEVFNESLDDGDAECRQAVSKADEGV